MIHQSHVLQIAFPIRCRSGNLDRTAPTLMLTLQMSETHYHLTQANIARAMAPLTDPLMQGFVEQSLNLSRRCSERALS